ncbi:MAG: hypothetical protein AAFO02_00530 [Bacteroidota bacterium]
MSNQLPETTEFFDAVFATIAQGVQSFSDGADLVDIPAFFDEALLWQKGVNGFAENFGPEAQTAGLTSIHSMFDGYESQLITSGLDPILAAAAVTQTKGFYLIYAALKQGQAKTES